MRRGGKVLVAGDCLSLVASGGICSLLIFSSGDGGENATRRGAAGGRYGVCRRRTAGGIGAVLIFDQGRAKPSGERNVRAVNKLAEGN